MAGKRVAISLDGGRLRTREGGRCGRRRKKTGRRGFRGEWREPILLAIYELDEQGKKASSKPIYEATMGNWDRAFEILAALAIHLGIRHAREVAVIADGARHIWRRVKKLLRRIGCGPATEILDFCHAAKKIHDIAGVPNWDDARRKKWEKAARRDLKQGEIDRLITRILDIRCGPKTQDVRKHVGYFTRNEQRLAYPSFRARNLPIGSGPVESAVRRVINLRPKNVGIFWRPESAEMMLKLRCYLKSGRWSELFEVVHGERVERELRQAA